MSSWRETLQRPADEPVEAWLAAIAHRLLNGVCLVAGGEAHRLVEVEAYYHSADHPDPFAHCDPVQLLPARWYFHRTRGVYRSGSFKGIDLSFGDGKAFGGMLFRGLERADGTLVDGPSLLVDHLLAATGKLDVRTLDLAIGSREAGDPASPLRLEVIDEPARPVLTSARVGLSLKRTKPTEQNVGYLLRSYRYLSAPDRTAKGKVHMVLALLRRGESDDEVRRLTGCPAATVRRYREDFEQGRAQPQDLATYGGVELGTKELCRLHGYGAK
jgi:hypothetical protein